MTAEKISTKQDDQPKGRIRLLGRRRAKRAERAAEPATIEAPPVEIAPNDPILAYFQAATGPVEIDSIELDSPGLRALRDAGVKLVVPLVSQGELIGLLNLGPRLSEQDYSADDRKLLADLAGQAAPALRLGQLVQEQQVEARSRERIEQELKVAQLIQQQFLPDQLPELSGWQVSAFYRPAREVGGDFYDFIDLPDGRTGIVIGDVTDKGVPAALVMASTRSILRSIAPHGGSPGKVLEAVNELLVPDIPAQMFVTCLYGILDPTSGRFEFANAGHNLPYVGDGTDVREPRATGMPLGLLPGMVYEETVETLTPGENILLHSDGIAEAHNATREMFGFDRLQEVVREATGEQMIDRVLEEHDRFTEGLVDQEDDITLVALTRTTGAAYADESKLLSEFSVPSEEGNERLVISQVTDVIGEVVGGERLERLKTAVGEAAMNAIEHGNKLDAGTPVLVRVTKTRSAFSVAITDQGGERAILEAETPDIDAKLAGLQKPRGWGLFLIKNMVDDVKNWTEGDQHTVELTMNLEGGSDGN
ncbi:MAG: SpoIIE family protein phosphatase [Actinomycetota bacterium]|nr:SpoIIE family protein phosphatase [Actinomycetota bacterium]